MPPNPVPLRSLVVALTVSFSVAVIAWTAIGVYWQRHGVPDDTYSDLRIPYLGLCISVAVALAGLGVGRVLFGFGLNNVSILSFLIFLPWVIYGINFVGRGHLITRRRLYLSVLTMGVAFGPIFADVIVSGFDFFAFQIVSILVSLLGLLILAVVFAVGGAVLVSAHRHRSLSLVHGFVVVLPVGAIMLIVQLSRPSLPVFNDAVFVTMSLTTAGTMALLPTRYDLLRRQAGTGTIGERTAIREMDEAIVTVERDGALARVNRAATELFGSATEAAPFADVIGQDITALADQETIECWTEEGHKQFDPRVTELTNTYDEVVGYTIILIDVTDREIRRQRIEVLNRILRHNIRNNLDVIKADAELVDDEERAASILDTTDTLDRLSADARRIESLLRRSQDTHSPAEIDSIVGSVAETVASEHPEVTIALDFPDHSFRADAELCRFAIRNVVENAAVHNDGADPRVDVRGVETQDGMRIVVADDGPGIPEPERSVIEDRTETPQSHGSSLGLWGTNWAVKQLGGELSFRESDLGGTAAVIELPAR
jgi:signal transduction histidine kinase